MRTIRRGAGLCLLSKGPGEFAAEADGYIVGVIGADFPSTAQGSGFVRTGKIAKLLIGKL